MIAIIFLLRIQQSLCKKTLTHVPRLEYMRLYQEQSYDLTQRLTYSQAEKFPSKRIGEAISRWLSHQINNVRQSWTAGDSYEV
jgi:hypothetical protein